MRKLKNLSLLIALSIVVGPVGVTGTVSTVCAADYIDSQDA